MQQNCEAVRSSNHNKLRKSSYMTVQMEKSPVMYHKDTCFTTTLKQKLPGALRSHPSNKNKKQKSFTGLVPIVFADLNLKNSTKPSTVIKVLLDSGANATLIKASWLPNLHQTTDNVTTRWTTSAGTFKTKHKAIAQMIFAEHHEGKTITCQAHVAPNLGAYEMIIGREILKELGLILNVKDETIE